MFRKNAASRRYKTLRPTGFVVPDTGNAVWAMQFLWSVKMQFVIAYVSADYQFTIVARERRDFVWIMAASPSVSDDAHDQLRKRVADIGYDTARLRTVPHPESNTVPRSD